MVWYIYETNSPLLFFPLMVFENGPTSVLSFYPVQLLSPWFLVKGVKLVLTLFIESYLTESYSLLDLQGATAFPLS